MICHITKYIVVFVEIYQTCYDMYVDVGMNSYGKPALKDGRYIIAPDREMLNVKPFSVFCEFPYKTIVEISGEYHT